MDPRIRLIEELRDELDHIPHHKPPCFECEFVDRLDAILSTPVSEPLTFKCGHTVATHGWVRHPPLTGEPACPIDLVGYATPVSESVSREDVEGRHESITDYVREVSEGVEGVPDPATPRPLSDTGNHGAPSASPDGYVSVGELREAKSRASRAGDSLSREYVAALFDSLIAKAGEPESVSPLMDEAKYQALLETMDAPALRRECLERMRVNVGIIAENRALKRKSAGEPESSLMEDELTKELRRVGQRLTNRARAVTHWYLRNDPAGAPKDVRDLVDAAADMQAVVDKARRRALSQVSESPKEEG